MSEKMGKYRTFCFLFFAFYLSLAATAPFCRAGASLDKTTPPDKMARVWDPNRYIGIDEISPGMEAYCLTGYRGTEIEKFNLEVLDVVHNFGPARNAILVKGTDERFVRTGPVAGCSGSPVYINGRLAGALAFSFFFSKDPFYGVTPIEEILRVGQAGSSGAGDASVCTAGFIFDFSRPIDFDEVDKQITHPQLSANNNVTGLAALPCPLITSGLSAEVCEQLNASVEPFALMAVAGLSGGSSINQSETVRLVPGACLTVPLVTGDITMELVGTVTEVIGDQVYGFGHGFLGYGPINLPMATGKVHTVVSSLYRSFKIASALEVVGAFTNDESAGIRGQIGAKARLIPLVIRIERYNDTDSRVYNCQIADNQILTPLVLRAAVAGATLMLGNLPPENAIEYKVNIAIEGTEPITFENVSTGVGPAELIAESAGSVALLMNNPYKKVDIKSIDFDIRIEAKNIISHIWSVDLSDSKVKAGHELEVVVVVESFLGGRKQYPCRFKIPEQLAPGKYDLIVCGSSNYQDFLKEAVPYKFMALDMKTLLEAMNNVLSTERDKLYCLLVLPPAGLAVESAELPDLPATKALVLQDAKRTLRSQPYQHWLEKSFKTGTIVIDKKVMQITVGK